MKLTIDLILVIITSILTAVSFFIIKTLTVFNVLECTPITEMFEYILLLFFLPSFFYSIRKSFILIKKDQIKKKFLETILNASCLVSKADKKGKITEVNSKFCEVSGYKEHELLGKNHSILNSGYHAKDFWKEMYISTVNYKACWHEIITNRKKNGKEYIVDSYIMATFDNDGNHNGYISVRQDVTELMNSLKEVDRKNAYLEHAAKILRHDMHSGINTYIPRGIKSLERRLEKLACDDIIDNIKSPMKMLKEGLLHTQKVYKGVTEFTNLVKKDASLNKESLDASDCLKIFLKSTSYSSQVQIEDLGILEINESLFCTAIDNLIRNGLRYNDSNSKMVKIYRIDNIISVEDNGRGMTQAEFEELSKPYTRKEGNKESGSGLGLNICVSIMKEHGFNVTCEKLNTGTKINIKIND